jgi:hypothetical protein
VPLLLNGGSLSKPSAPPLFLEDENIFQNSARAVLIIVQSTTKKKRNQKKLDGTMVADREFDPLSAMYTTEFF